MESIISIKNVSFSYSGGVNVLENLSFDIYKKDFIAIIGANGSGKSTLLKLILREVVENLEALEDEGEIYESIEEIWPDYPTEEDYLWNEDEY